MAGLNESSQPSLFDDDDFKQWQAAGRALKGGKWTHCIECGRELRTKRSQHYGIGPECEETNSHVIDFTDIANGATWESLERTRREADRIRDDRDLPDAGK